MKQVKLGNDTDLDGVLCVRGQVVIVPDDYDLDDDDIVLAVIDVKQVEADTRAALLAARRRLATRPPRIVSFTADVTTVTANAPVVLTWIVRRADTVTLEGVAVNPAGTRTVTPNRSKTYNLVATNLYGDDRAKIIITVQ